VFHPKIEKHGRRTERKRVTPDWCQVRLGRLYPLRAFHGASRTLTSLFLDMTVCGGRAAEVEKSGARLDV
jgi:hypothetical protein